MGFFFAFLIKACLALSTAAMMIGPFFCPLIVGILLGKASLAFRCWKIFQKKYRSLIHKCSTAQTSDGSKYLNFGFLFIPLRRALSPAEKMK